MIVKTAEIKSEIILKTLYNKRKEKCRKSKKEKREKKIEKKVKKVLTKGEVYDIIIRHLMRAANARKNQDKMESIKTNREGNLKKSFEKNKKGLDKPKRM